VFRKVAEERGVNIEFSAPIETVDIEKTIVVLRDGRRLEADLIIGADGEEWLSSTFDHLSLTRYRDRLHHQAPRSRTTSRTPESCWRN
jgi:2-polyprenyl-6-methoxyphenol hydroxylase-like FAD-dependent oxidoreductase